MKFLNKEAKKKFASNKGELLVETMISLLILAILIAVVTSVIVNALGMITNSGQRARDLQSNQINPAILIDYEDPANETSILFTCASTCACGLGLNVFHEIYFRDEGIIAFTPKVVTP
jgi:competence protein ComGC